MLAVGLIQVNQVGFVPDAAKICVCMDPPEKTFHVMRLDEETGMRRWHEVMAGEFKPEGKAGRMIGDFSAVTREGDYRIVCGPTNIGKGRVAKDYPGLASSDFVIWHRAYDSAKRLFSLYYTWQRCGSKKGWAGLCHQSLCPLVGTDRVIDARGGYHQSCDLRNWADGVSLSVYCLLRYAEIEKPLWDEGELADEIRWGCDYFLRISEGDGYVYESQFEPIGWGPRNYYARPAALGAQANVVMLFSRASRFFSDLDKAYSVRLLVRAKTIFRQMEENPFFASAQSSPLPREQLPGGSQPWETWYHSNYRTSALGFSQRAAAALELYRTTQEIVFRDMAKGFARNAISKMTSGEKLADGCSYTHRLSAERLFLELAKEFGDDEWKDRVALFAEAIESRLKAQDMCSGELKWRGSPTTAAWNALYLAEAAKLLGRAEYRVLAQRALDWTYGTNPECRSYIDGIGQNQVRRPVFGQFFPSTPQIPGAVLHRYEGEYDMPAVGFTLWATARLTRGGE